MDWVSIAALGSIGLASGFLAGFLGIGGGVIIVPALVFAAGLPVKLASGISIVEVFFATLSGLVVHRRNRTVDLRLGCLLGSGGVVGASIGSVGSAFLSGRTLLILFLVPLSAALLLLSFAPTDGKEVQSRTSFWIAGCSGMGIGIVSGLLGIGGGFLLVPLMISVLRVPTKVAVGTSLLVILMTSFAGAAGKVATGQFDLQIGLFVVVGAIVGAHMGGKVSSRLSARAIRISLSALLIAIMARTGLALLAS